MDTNAFLKILGDKNTKEKVLDALEKVQIRLAVLIKKGNVSSADEALNFITLFVNDARSDYENACLSYYEAAKDTFNAATTDVERAELKENRL